MIADSKSGLEQSPNLEQPDPRGPIYDVHVYRRNLPTVEYQARHLSSFEAINTAMDAHGLDVRVSAKVAFP